MSTINTADSNLDEKRTDFYNRCTIDELRSFITIRDPSKLPSRHHTPKAQYGAILLSIDKAATFRLMDLPKELRMHVYDELLGYKGSTHARLWPEILAGNRQVHSEAEPILRQNFDADLALLRLTENTIRFGYLGRFKSWNIFSCKLYMLIAYLVHTPILVIEVRCRPGKPYISASGADWLRRVEDYQTAMLRPLTKAGTRIEIVIQGASTYAIQCLQECADPGPVQLSKWRDVEMQAAELMALVVSASLTRTGVTHLPHLLRAVLQGGLDSRVVADQSLEETVQTALGEASAMLLSPPWSDLKMKAKQILKDRGD